MIVLFVRRPVFLGRADRVVRRRRDDLLARAAVPPACRPPAGYDTRADLLLFSDEVVLFGPGRVLWSLSRLPQQQPDSNLILFFVISLRQRRTAARGLHADAASSLQPRPGRPAAAAGRDPPARPARSSAGRRPTRLGVDRRSRRRRADRHLQSRR